MQAVELLCIKNVVEIKDNLDMAQSTWPLFPIRTKFTHSTVAPVMLRMRVQRWKLQFESGCQSLGVLHL